jgi:hypothetical protein
MGVYLLCWRCASQVVPRLSRFSRWLILFAAGAFVFSIPSITAQEKPKSPSSGASANSSRPIQNKLPVARENEEESGPSGLLKGERDSAESLRKRQEWFYKQRASVNGHIPAGARLRALQHMQRMMVREGKLVQRADGTFTAATPQIVPQTLSSIVWGPSGPAPTTGGIFSPVTGRVTTIAVDPSDTTGNTVLIGGAQGGIWRSTNAGATWTAVGDQNASLAMGSIAFAPSTCPAGSTTCTVYAGTGEQAGIGFDIYYGAGVFKSTDSGQTWAQTCTTASATCPFIGPFSDATPFGFFTLGGARISYIAVSPANPNLVLVAAQTQFAEGPTEGVYCSDTSGASWTNILSGEMATFVGFGSSTVAYAALGNTFGSAPTATNGNGIYKATGVGSTCASITFTRLTAATLPAQSTMGRIDIGIAPSDATGNTLYASIADASISSFTNLGVFVTTNGGTNWTQTGAPDICQAQCWYDNVVKVDPTSKDIVFLGGSSAGFTQPFTWVARSINGTTGGIFSPAIPNALSSALPHVDQHAIAFAKATTGAFSGKVRVYLGNDGGIWRSDDAEAATVTWTPINNPPLQLTQFYPSISINPANPNIAFGGTQDNGSQNYQGGVAWADNGQCGDGASTAVDQQIPSTVYIGCGTGAPVNASYQNGGLNTFAPAIGGINQADSSNFIAPIAVDPGSANVTYYGTTKVYQTTDAAVNWTALSGDLVQSGLTALAALPGNATNPGAVVYAGADTGQVFVATNVTSGTGTFNAVTGQASLPSRFVTAIAVDAADTSGKTAYIGMSGFSFVAGSTNDPRGHIFKTIDGGATFTDVSCAPTTTNCQNPSTGDLPNTPVNDIVLDPDAPGTIYAATDIGVFFTTGCTVAPCSWATLGTGLPHVAVLSLRLHEASRTLRAATHGRGAFDVVLDNVPFTGPRVFSISPTSANAGATTAVTLTVIGTGLTGGTVQFGGTALAASGTPTDTQIQATIPTTMLATAGTPAVAVATTTTTSNKVTFSILGGPPTISSSAPGSALVNSSTPQTINIVGTGFTANSKVVLNPDYSGTVMPTTFTSATQLSATVPASFMANFGSTNSVGVTNPPPGGGTTHTIMTQTQTVVLPTFVVSAPAPANNLFANATAISANTFQKIEDSSGATAQTGNPVLACIGQQQGGGGQNGSFNPVWFKFTPTVNGTLTDVDTIGSSYDTTMAILTGSQGALVQVPGACNDDINPGIVVQSQLQNIALSANTTYYIFVGSFGPPDPNPIALGGKLVFNFTFSPNTAPDFTMNPQPTSATVNSGNNATYTVAIAAQNGFTGNVTVSCSLMAATSNCSANPASVAPGSNAMITVTTTAHQLLPPMQSPQRFGPWRLVPVVVLALLALVLLAFVARTRRQRLAAAVPLAGLVLFLVLQAVGCGSGGGGGGGMHGTQAGTYTVTITGTSGSTTHTATVTLVVN